MGPQRSWPMLSRKAGQRTWALGARSAAKDRTSTSKESSMREASRMVARMARQIAEVESRKHGAWLIDPRTSTRMPHWDVCVAVALMFTAVVTPFEVAFLNSDVLPLFIVNRLIDTIFLADIVVQFFLAYPDDASNTQGARWVTDLPTIARHYLSGWFTVDVIATVFAILDVVVYLTNNEERISTLKALRVLRVLRLIKLLRLVRGMRMLKRWEMRLAINYGVLSLIQAMASVVMFSHWSACIWMVQNVFADELQSTWVYYFGYCIDRPPDPVVGDLARWDRSPPIGTHEEFVCLPPLTIYAAALYWAVLTITSIGYGDIHASPHQPREHYVAVLVMLFSGFVWSQVIGTFCGVIATMSPEETEFRITMDAINQYLLKHKHMLPSRVHQKVRDYFHRTKHFHGAMSNQRVLRKMTPSMQAEVLIQANRFWLNKVSWLRSEDHVFVTHIILALQPTVYAPKEVICESALHVVHSGVGLYGGKIVRAGSVWGDDMILRAPHLRSRLVARSVTYLELYFILRDTVLGIAKGFSDTWPRLQRRIRLMSLQRYIVLISKAMKHLKDAPDFDIMDATAGLMLSEGTPGTANKTSCGNLWDATFDRRALSSCQNFLEDSSCVTSEPSLVKCFDRTESFVESKMSEAIFKESRNAILKKQSTSNSDAMADEPPPSAAPRVAATPSCTVASPRHASGQSNTVVSPRHASGQSNSALEAQMAEMSAGMNALREEVRTEFRRLRIALGAAQDERWAPLVAKQHNSVTFDDDMSA